jgi:CheY-like chemotaxis protein
MAPSSSLARFLLESPSGGEPSPMMSRPVELLMVEDNPADALIAREALSEVQLENRLNVVPDGVEAMAYLRGENGYAERKLPDLVLLDLNMPRKDGREVLSEMKHDRTLCKIPVVVLTTSRSEEDVVRAYDLHANCYIAKPIDFVSFVDVVRAIREFWFSVVTLPKRV